MQSDPRVSRHSGKQMAMSGELRAVERRIRVAAAAGLSVAAILAALLAAGLVAGPAQAAAPPQDTIVVGYHEDLLTTDPMDFRRRETETILRNVYDGFVTRNPDMEIVNELAESVRPISDTVWEIRLRRGVTFHDGSPFTAQDAVFSIRRHVVEGAMGGRTSPRKGLFSPITDAEAVDDYTVRIHMSQPWPIFLRMLPHMLVAPRSVGNSMVTHPIGTGPFKFTAWEKGSQVVLERYDRYYGGAPDLPPVGPARARRVIFRVIPDAASRVAALLAGEVDLISAVPVDAIPTIERNPELEVLRVNGTRSYFVEMNVTKPPFNDVRVRRAMNHALDVQAVIDTVLNGLAVRIPTILSPQSFGYNPGIRPYPYDPARARQLLREAGYPNGFELELDTLPYRRQVAEAYALMLGEVGIRTRVRVWNDWGTLLEQIRAGRRQAWLQDWGSSILDPADIMTPKLRTADRGNYTGYSNPKVDALIDRMNTSIEPEVRRQAAYEAQELIFGDAPMVFEYVAQDIYAKNRRLQGWEPIPDSRINLHDAYKTR